MNPSSPWPPLDATVSALRDLLKSNREQATSSNIIEWEWEEHMNTGATLEGVTPMLSAGADPLGSGVPVFSASKNPFVGTSGTLSGLETEKRKTKKGCESPEVHLQYTTSY